MWVIQGFEPMGIPIYFAVKLACPTCTSRRNNRLGSELPQHKLDSIYVIVELLKSGLKKLIKINSF